MVKCSSHCTSSTTSRRVRPALGSGASSSSESSSSTSPRFTCPSHTTCSTISWSPPGNARGESSSAWFSSLEFTSSSIKGTALKTLFRAFEDSPRQWLFGGRAGSLMTSFGRAFLVFSVSADKVGRHAKNFGLRILYLKDCQLSVP